MTKIPRLSAAALPPSSLPSPSSSAAWPAAQPAAQAQPAAMFSMTQTLPTSRGPAPGTPGTFDAEAWPAPPPVGLDGTSTGSAGTAHGAASPRPPAGRAPTLGTLPQVALVAAMAGPAVYVLGALFDGWRYLAPLAGAVGLAAVLGWLAARRLASLELVALTGLAGGLLSGTAALAGRADALLRDLGAGWPRLLSAPLPSQPTAILLVPPAAVLWATTFAAVVLALRGRGALLPAAPPLAGLVVSLVLVGRAGAADHPLRVLAAGGFVACALALAALRAGWWSPARTAPPRPPAANTGPAPAAPQVQGAARRQFGVLTVGLPVVAVIVAAGIAAGVVVPVDANRRYDPREHWHPPVENVDTLSPLVRVRTQLEQTPPEDLFHLTIDSAGGGLPVDRVRIAALGEFDGATWRDSGRFVRVDGALPADPDAVATTVRRADVTADVTISGLGGAGNLLLPSLGVPTSIAYDAAAGSGQRRSTGAAYQPASGSLATVTTASAGDHYRLGTQVAFPTKQQLEAAVPASGPAAAANAGLPPDAPSSLSTLAIQVTEAAGSQTPYARLLALQEYLRDDTRFPYDLGAAPGHSYGALARFLTGKDPGDQHGYAEQRAVAFAVLARAAGFASRVVVGYLLDQNRVAADGAFVVTTAQAHTWPEVLLAGIGWVAFEPTDVSQLSKTLPPPAAATSTAPTAGAGDTEQAATAEVVPPVIIPPVDASGQASAGSGGLGWPWVALLVAGAVVIGCPLLVVGEKARRRRARRRGAPGPAVAGAWREARDRLAEHGVSRSRALTQRQVVAIVAGTPAVAAAAEPLRALAAVTDVAFFAPDGARAEDADLAWRLAGHVRRQAGAAAGVTGRVRAALDPRPLLPPRAAPGRAATARDAVALAGARGAT